MKATEAATAALREFIAVAQSGGGISSMMFCDPYILGFLYMTAGLHAKAVTKNRIGLVDLGFATRDALHNTTNMNADFLVEQAIAFQKREVAEYQKGAEEAFLYFMYIFDQIDESAGHPLIEEAKLAAPFFETMGLGAGHQSAVAAGLLSLTFRKRLKSLREQYNHA